MLPLLHHVAAEYKLGQDTGKEKANTAVASMCVLHVYRLCTYASTYMMAHRRSIADLV